MMTQIEKDLLCAKAETLYSSIADVQLQAVMGIMCDLIRSIAVDNKPSMGFGKDEDR